MKGPKLVETLAIMMDVKLAEKKVMQKAMM